MISGFNLNYKFDNLKYLSLNNIRMADSEIMKSTNLEYLILE